MHPTANLFDEKTIQHLKSYVYLLLDPTTDEPFYVGKGKGNRVFHHIQGALETTEENLKHNSIKAIHSKGLEVKHLIVRHGLSDASAFEIEASLIDTFKYIPKFNEFANGNIQSGSNSIEKGLMTSNEVIRLYNAQTLENIAPDCIIININKTYKRASGKNAIYIATKEIWKITASRRNAAKYILSEYKGLIVEVFEVIEWYPKERGYNKGSKRFGQTYIGFGFDGQIAPPKIRNKYLNKSIAAYKKQGFASVIIFPETLQKLKK